MLRRVILSTLFCVVASQGFAQKLPDKVEWLTNDTDPEYADLNAKKGGTFYTWMASFPATLRMVGPDATGGQRQLITDNLMTLIGIHPNTENVMPQLATHWAYDKDNRTMYFKINPAAKWSDGKPLTADDFVFTREFMLSKNIVDPWYNDFYTKEISGVNKIDDHTVAVVSAVERPRSNLNFTNGGLHPWPKHYFKGEVPKDFIQKYNWEIMPVVGPYIISDVKKGKSITVSRIKNWWGEGMRFYRGRFNADKIQIDVIRDVNVAWEYFKNGKIDTFAGLMNPLYWHEKAKGPIFDKGYVERVWFYNDNPQSPMGLYINEGMKPLDEINVRLGIAYSMNLEKVISTILRGDYLRLDQMYVGFGKYTDETIKARTFDLAKANEYFDKAGFKERGPDGIRVRDGKRLSFRVTYYSDNWTPRFVILKEEAKKAGLELTLQMLDGSAHYKMSAEKKHEITFFSWTTNMRPVYYENFHSDFANKPDNNNINNTNDKELDQLIDKHRKTFNEDEIIALGKKIQNKIHDRAIFIPFFSVPFAREAYWRWMKLPKVPGVKLLDSDLFMPQQIGPDGGYNFWIDEEAKKETLAAMKSGKTFPPVTKIDTTFKKK